MITTKSDFFYDLIVKVSNNNKTSTQNCKTYFYLESILDSNLVEVTEAYYNGVLKNMRLDEIHLKKGRIALKNENNRHFSTTENSRLFVTLNVFNENEMYPSNPLQFKKAALKKYFEISLDAKIESNEGFLYVIDFKPRIDNGTFFSGKLFIDSKSLKLNKIELHGQNFQKHPFLAFHSNGIDQTDIDISILFENENDEMFLSDFIIDYSITYRDIENISHKVQSKTFIKNYELNSNFNLPLFQFSDFYSKDYRDFTAVPFDSLFWIKNNEFSITHKNEESQHFLNNNIIVNNLFIQTDTESKKRFAWPYQIWSKERISINSVSEEIIAKAALQKPIERDRMKFDTKFYLDANNLDGKIHYQLYSIFDPINSFYLFPINPSDLIFINIYFDLLEIEKRKLETKLNRIKPYNFEEIKQLYAKSYKEFYSTGETFIKEVWRGKRKDKLSKWNDIVLKELDIDNIKYFENSMKDKIK